MNSEKASRLEGIPGVTTPWRGGGTAARRDMELIRELLLELEAGGGARPLDGWSDATLRDHLRLLVEAGLTHGRATAASEVEFYALTWAGHDFLAAVRDDTVWRKVRAKLVEAGGGIAFETLKQLAISFLP